MDYDPNDGLTEGERAERDVAVRAGRRRREAQRSMRTKSLLSSLGTGLASGFLLFRRAQESNTKALDILTAIGVSATGGLLCSALYAQTQLNTPDYTNPEEVAEFKRLLWRNMQEFLTRHPPEKVYGSVEAFVADLERLLAKRVFTKVVGSLKPSLFITTLRMDAEVARAFSDAFMKWLAGQQVGGKPKLLTVAEVGCASYFQTLTERKEVYDCYEKALLFSVDAETNFKPILTYLTASTYKEVRSANICVQANKVAWSKLRQHLTLPTYGESIHRPQGAQIGLLELVDGDVSKGNILFGNSSTPPKGEFLKANEGAALLWRSIMLKKHATITLSTAIKQLGEDLIYKLHGVHMGSPAINVGHIALQKLLVIELHAATAGSKKDSKPMSKLLESKGVMFFQKNAWGVLQSPGSYVGGHVNPMCEFTKIIQDYKNQIEQENKSFKEAETHAKADLQEKEAEVQKAKDQLDLLKPAPQEGEDIQKTSSYMPDAALVAAANMMLQASQKFVVASEEKLATLVKDSNYRMEVIERDSIAEVRHWLQTCWSTPDGRELKAAMSASEALVLSFLGGAEAAPPIQSQQSSSADSQASRHQTSSIEIVHRMEELQAATLCKVCMVNPLEITFEPCHHFVTCGVCSERMRQCPICRSIITGQIRTFQG